MEKLQLMYTFVWDWDVDEKEDIYDIVARNVNQKMDSYLAKLFAVNDDMEVRIKITLQKNEKKFNGSFFLRYSWSKQPLVYIREWFEKLDDLINHAFDHFKLRLSK